MKTKIILSLFLIFVSFSGFCTVWTVNNSGTTYTPATITINLGDTVNFSIDGSHNALEVSQSTWNANGNTALSGGFQTSYGGGIVLPAQLSVGTHYYVCVPHASMGMKGTIIVQNCSVPAQPATISGNAAVCATTSNTYSVTTVAGATSYTWTIPGGWTGSSTTNSINTMAGSSSGNITVKANNSCGSSPVRTFSVTANTVPAQPAFISGNAAVCATTSNTYSVTAVSGAASYTWTIPGGWTGSSTTNSITATAGTTSGNITVTANNSCGSSLVRTFSVTANTVPAQPAAISGNAAVCATTSNTYSVAAVSGATSYTWTIPGGWTGSSTTNSIAAMSGTSSGNITVKANNSCGSSVIQTLNITTNIVDTSVTVSGHTLTANAAGASYQWINCNGNIPVSGQMNQSFTPVSSGSYAVIVSKNGCSDTSYCYNISIVGIHENIALSPYHVFPNPSNGKFTIEALNFENASIKIFNVVGAEIYQSSTSNQITVIDLSNQPKGIYFVKINTEKSSFTKRIVIQ